MRYKVKKLSLLFFLVFAATTLFAQNTAQPTVQKIGYADIGAIMQQYGPAVKVGSDLESLTLKYRKMYDSMTVALQNEYADFQKKQPTMKADQIKEANTKFTAKNQAIGQFNQEKTTELNQKRDQWMAPINDAILKAIEAVAKDEGMNFVFNKTGESILPFADATADLTFKVLDKLKRGK
jgi:outer membrane protein